MWCDLHKKRSRWTVACTVALISLYDVSYQFDSFEIIIKTG